MNDSRCECHSIKFLNCHLFLLCLSLQISSMLISTYILQVGGGEPGPPKSYKLAAKDSSHVEIMRIGTYNPQWGGVSQQDIVDAIESGRILIPQIEVVPTAVIANPDTPPELEIRFDMDPPVPDFDDFEAELPVNWQLRFIHNQLFKFFEFPSRFCPGM